MSEPGADAASGPGADAVSGPGADAVSGPGADTVSGPIPNAISGFPSSIPVELTDPADHADLGRHAGAGDVVVELDALDRGDLDLEVARELDALCLVEQILIERRAVRVALDVEIVRAEPQRPAPALDVAWRPSAWTGQRLARLGESAPVRSRALAALQARTSRSMLRP